MDVAQLGIEVDSRGVVRGADNLDEFAVAGARADKSARGVGSASRAASGGVSLLTKAVAGAVGAIVSLNFAGNALSSAKAFNAALAETSTLIGGTAEELEFLEKAARGFAGEFGSDATSQINAFYQAISAGAGSVEDAASLLNSANKLAQGGATDVTTGVDALTTAINAYAATGLTAAQASDALFVGIKGGKTTAAELSAALGNIVPIAASVGVEFDELIAGVAALTTQGQTTSVAVTGLRQVISGVLKPTTEATKLADALGLSFDAQSLKAKGLSGFLADVIDKTGGSQTAMGQLFGSVEALNAVLSFAGGGGEAFTDILDDMSNKLGATDEAVNKVSDALSVSNVSAYGTELIV